jgi:hypothetical protein
VYFINEKLNLNEVHRFLNDHNSYDKVVVVIGANTLSHSKNNFGKNCLWFTFIEHDCYLPSNVQTV